MKLSLTFILLLLTIAASYSAETFKKREFPIDEVINPCSNLYEYACNKANQSYTLPASRRRHSFSFDDIRIYLFEEKKAYFNSIKELTSSNERENQIQAFFLSCMNEGEAKKAEQELVARMQSEVQKISTREEFIEFLSNKMKSGGMSFLDLAADLPNLENSKHLDAYLNIVPFAIGEKSYYEKPELREAYRKLITTFFEELKISNAAQKAAWVDQFEGDLAKVYPSGVEINKNTFAPTTLLFKTIKNLKNLKLEEFLHRLPKKTHLRNIYGDDPLVYLDNSIGTKPVEQLKAIYLYYALKGYMDDAYPKWKNEAVAFDAKYLGGAPTRPDREERCTLEIEDKFGKELDYTLLPKLFPNFPKEKLSKLVESIRKNLIKTVQNNNWLSNGARKAAALKLKKLNIRLVSPVTEEEWGFRKTGKYSSTNLSANRELFKKLNLEKSFENLAKTYNGPVWEFGPLSVNAGLLPPYNAIIFPIAILQPPFYDPTATDETNLAGIGAVIGHEIGHAIDDKGFTYDYKGRVRPWIKDTDEKMFQKRTAPLIEEFNAIGLNGQFNLGENIGDLVGLTNAYQSAFPKGSNKPEAVKKDFFIQWARLWCEVQRPELVELRKKIDPHSLGFARANEPVKHIAGFAETFSCKAGDPLVLPEEKRLKIW